MPKSFFCKKDKKNYGNNLKIIKNIYYDLRLNTIF